jgi:hypothetical protein
MKKGGKNFLDIKKEAEASFLTPVLPSIYPRLSAQMLCAQPNAIEMVGNKIWKEIFAPNWILLKISVSNLSLPLIFIKIHTNYFFGALAYRR